MGEEIICMTYEQWEEKHNQMARCEAKERQRRWNDKHEADRERRKYFCNQRFMGAIVVLISVIVFIMFCDLPTFVMSAMGCIFGGTLICTNKMVIINKYYWEHGGEDQWD